MNIKNDIETINKVIKEKYSITRFGDGEFYHLFNTNYSKGAGRQKCNPVIRSKLKEIIRSNNENLIVGISGFLASENQVDILYKDYTDYMKNFITKTLQKLKKSYPELLKKDFYSAEITRLTNSSYKHEIIELFNDFFINNDFIFVGNKDLINLIKDNFYDRFQSIEFYEVKKIHAFDDYDEIYKNCLKLNEKKNKIFLLSIGITATILTYDLSQNNFHSIDIGHYFELLHKHENEIENNVNDDINLVAKDINNSNISTSNLHIFDMMKLLIDKYNFKLIDINKLYESNINEYFLNKYGKYPKNIFLVKGSSGIHKFKINSSINVSFLIDDVHPGGSTRKERIKSLRKTKNVFCTYAYHFYNYYPKGNYNLFWLPHSIRFNDIKFNENPDKKIIITGRLHKKIYPNRNIMYILAKKNRDIIYLKPNIGYRVKKQHLNDKMLFGRKFLLKLNSYLCGFTCDLIAERPYIVAKHFEIMGSGSLLLACNINTKKYFEKLGFEDMKDYVSCNPENINEKIKFILDENNLNLINKIRLSGYNKTLKYHNYEKRTEYLYNIINDNYISYNM